MENVRFFPRVRCGAWFTDARLSRARAPNEADDRSAFSGAFGERALAPRWPLTLCSDDGRMAHDVFVSHSSKDRQIAQAICHQLEAGGIRCWMAPRDILPGMEWDESIMDAIENSRLMVLVYSAASNGSGPVINEVRNAVRANSIIIPFRVEDVPLSRALQFHIGGAHWLDALTEPLSRHIEVLANTIGILLSTHGGVPRGEARAPERERSVEVVEPKAQAREPEAVQHSVKTSRLAASAEVSTDAATVEWPATPVRSRRRLVAALSVIVVAAVGLVAYGVPAWRSAGVVATAGDNRLMVADLADLLAKTDPKTRLDSSAAREIATRWRDYQLAAMAGADGDSLVDDPSFEAVYRVVALKKMDSRLNDTLKSRRRGLRPADAQAYARGDYGLYAAHAIFFAVDSNASADQRAIVRSRAEKTLAEISDATFAAAAARLGTGLHDNPRHVDVFGRSKVPKPLGDAVAALQPGRIATRVVEADDGFYIVQRATYESAKSAFDSKFEAAAGDMSDAAYLSEVERESRLRIVPEALRLCREAARDVAKYRDSELAVATYNGGTVTIRQLLDFARVIVPNSSDQVLIDGVADSVSFKPQLRILIIDAILAQRWAATLTITNSDRVEVRTNAQRSLLEIWDNLGVSPAALAGAATSAADRRRVAADHATQAVRRVSGPGGHAFEVDNVIADALHRRYRSSLNIAAFAPAVEQARRQRADSASTAQP